MYSIHTSVFDQHIYTFHTILLIQVDTHFVLRVTFIFIIPFVCISKLLNTTGWQTDSSTNPSKLTHEQSRLHEENKDFKIHMITLTLLVFCCILCTSILSLLYKMKYPIDFCIAQLQMKTCEIRNNPQSFCTIRHYRIANNKNSDQWNYKDQSAACNSGLLRKLLQFSLHKKTSILFGIYAIFTAYKLK